MANRGVERESVIGINHLKQVKLLLEKSVGLLKQGTGVVPYENWKNTLSDLLDEIREEIGE